jgi:hypothetical protein
MTTAPVHARVRTEAGFALLLTLFLTMALSMTAAGLILLSQTDTRTSTNYRLMSQARYGAESGIQVAVNYLINSYAAPVAGGADPIASYDTTVSPVTYNGEPVVLSANADVPSNYPVAAVQDAFAAAAQGTLAAGANTSVAYKPSATLMSMQQVNVYGGGQQTIQTWQITSTGSITSAQNAEVEVSAVLETQKMPATLYAAFGTNGGCGALRFAGGARTDSYNSAALVGGNPVIANSNGGVGTNGNLTESGGATINGTVSSPRVGVGSCSSGNVDALTSSGGATVTGGVVQLPQAWNPASPIVTMPSPAPPTSNVSISSSTTCLSLGLAVYPLGPCTLVSPGHLTFTPTNLGGSSLTLGSLSLSGGATLTIKGGTINLNSLTISGGSVVTVAEDTATNVSDVAMTIVRNVSVSGGGSITVPADKSASVTMGIVNTSGVGTPVSMSGGAVTNNSYDPSLFQIKYAGTGNISVSGGAKFATVIYAPNASSTLSGGGDIYGSIVAATITDTGGAQIHYDTNLPNLFVTAGNPMMSSFSWKKY